MIHLIVEWLGKIALLISICYTRLFASHIETIKVYSESMRKNIPALIVIPESFKKSSNDQACLILLHGWGGNYISWKWIHENLKQKADEYNMLIVCPDGGFDSWYIDSPINNKIKYETFISQELTSYLKNNYNISQRRNKYCIAGISMGGHGAALIAMKYKHIFGGFASTSGGLDLSEFPNGWNLKRILGKQKKYPDNWKINSAINYIPDIENNELKIWIDCGKSDFFLGANQRFHQILELNGIHHTYHEWEGEHNIDYWAKSVLSILDFFGNYFLHKK